MIEPGETLADQVIRKIGEAPTIVVEQPPYEVLEQLLGLSSDMITVADSDGRCTYASPAVIDIIGMTPSEIVGQSAAVLIHPDDLEGLIIEAARQIEEQTGPLPIVYRQIGPGGVWRHVEARIRQLPPGHPLGEVVVNTRDVSDRIEAEHAYRESQQVIRMVAEGQPIESILGAIVELVERRAPGAMVAVTRVDELTKTLGLATAPNLPAAYAESIDGLPIPGGSGSSVMAVLRREPVMTADIATDPLWEHGRGVAAENGLRACWSYPLQTANAPGVLGTLDLYWPHPMEASTEYCGLMAEAGGLATIALTRARSEDELAHRATHDVLTGLPNRTLLHDRIDQALERHRRNGGDDVVVMFIDLDRFKEVNDRLGHDVGDLVLQDAANRLRVTVRAIDTVARLGGDEFVVLAHSSDAPTLARRLNTVMAAPFGAAKGADVSCSIGVAISTGTESPAALIRRADQALYRAKAAGRNGFVIEGAEPDHSVPLTEALAAQHA